MNISLEKKWNALLIEINLVRKIIPIFNIIMFHLKPTPLSLSKKKKKKTIK